MGAATSIPGSAAHGKRWQQLTTTLLQRIQSELVQACKPQSGGSGGSGGSSTDCGSWSLQTTSIGPTSIQNVDCKSIVIGSSTRVTAPTQACCSYDFVASLVLKTATEITTSTPELNKFLAALLGITEGQVITLRGKDALASFMRTQFQAQCGSQGVGVEQTVDVNNILFSADSRTRCHDLSIALNTTSSNIACMINRIAQSQRAVSPASWRPPSRVPWKVLSIGAAVALTILGVALVLHLQRKRPVRARMSSSNRLLTDLGLRV